MIAPLAKPDDAIGESQQVLKNLTHALEEVLDGETWQTYQRLISLPGAQDTIRNNLTLFDELRPSTELEGLLVVLLRNLAECSSGDLDDEISGLYPYLVKDDCAALRSNNGTPVPMTSRRYLGHFLLLDVVKDNLYSFTTEYVPDDSHIAALRLLSIIENSSVNVDRIPIWLDGVVDEGIMAWSRAEIEMEYFANLHLAFRLAAVKLEGHVQGDSQGDNVSLILSQVIMFLQIQMVQLFNGDGAIDETPIAMALLRSRWLLSPAILVSLTLLSMEYNEEWAACLL